MAGTDGAVVGEVERELELLLPWHAIGLSSDREAAEIKRALAASPNFRSRFSEVRRERAETIGLNEELGVPSARVEARLMAAIEGECASKRHRPGPRDLAVHVSRNWLA